MTRFKRSFGFSIVELLIVITIIGVLTATGTVVYKGATDNSKDQQRLRDLNSIKQALELYRHAERSYPKQLSELATYLSPLPVDPQASAGKQYAYATSPSTCTTALRNCKAYVVCAKKQGDKVYDLPSGCSSVACSGSVGDCDLGVTSDDPFLIVPTPTPLPPTPTPTPANTLWAGLVSYWKMDETNDNTCVPGGNADACDSVSSNHATSGNAAFITNGKIGNGRAFNGLNKFLVMEPPTNLRLSRFTISAWIYENTVNGVQAIYSYSDEGQVGGPVFYTNGEGRIALSASGISSCQTDRNHFTGDRFYHMVVTHDGSNCRFYVQGELEATKPLAGSFNYGPGRAFIGTANLNSAFFNGTIDEVGVWNRVLTDTEIRSLYNGGAGQQP